MKKALVTIAIVLGSMVVLLATILITPADYTIYVGKKVGARVDCVAYVSSTLNWGDGAQQSGGDDQFWSAFHYHVYKNPGTFMIHFHRNYLMTPSCPVDEYKSVTIVENRSITMSTSQPMIGMPVTFTAVNFNTPTDVTWDMGDGMTYAHNKNIITHTYQKSGSFTVRAFDWNGNTATTPVSLALAFSRSIVYSPLQPRVDQPVDIRAVSFRSDTIDWNFGDGTPPAIYSAAVSHRYPNPGAFHHHRQGAQCGRHRRRKQGDHDPAREPLAGALRHGGPPQ